MGLTQVIRSLRLFNYPRRLEDLTLFTRHVAGAMNTRAPLPVILRAYALESDSNRLAKIAGRIAERVESGVELSAAMEEYPKDFPSAYRRLVKLGEQSRTLGRVMTQLADMLDRILNLNESMRRAVIYPLFVLLTLFWVTTGFAHKILPVFTDIFLEMGHELPVAGALSTAATLTQWGLFALITVIIGMALGLRMKFMDYGRLPLELPLIGPVLRLSETARFADFLALMLDNRVPVGEALGLMADASENAYVRQAMRDFHERFEAGERLSDLIGSQPLFPAGLAAVVAHAEDQGAMADSLKHLGEFYRARTEHGMRTLKEILEPMAMVGLGLVVVLVMLGIYNPIFQLRAFFNS